jgi:negative regulator of sigma-B (phosphoserine phosphatase)
VIVGPAIPGVSVRAAHVCLPMPGEVQNGDAVLFRHNEHKQAMLAVIDGLGHGPDAAKASRAAIEQLSLLPVACPVLEAMQAVHQALRDTRGAAGTLCVINGFRLEVCAVGNVQFMCTNLTIPLVLSAGVLGHQVSRFRVGVTEIRVAARIALVSDGISTRFRLEELKAHAPAEACQLIVSRHRRKEDDATVLIADIDP